MPVLGAATLELNADAARLEQDMGAAVAKATALGTAVGHALGNAIETGVGKIADMVSRALTAGEEINKASQKSGLSVEQYSALKVQADLADVSMKSLGRAMRELSVHAVEAGDNAEGKVGRAFAAMGIAVKDAEGNMRPTKELFDEFAGKMAGYEDGANKVALATAIMGRSGAELIPLFNDIEKTKNLAEELGLVMSKDQAEASERFKDNMKIAALGADAFGIRLAQSVLPTLEKFSGFLVANAKDLERLDSVGRTADTGLKIVATAASIVGNVFKTVGEYIGATAAGMVQLMSGNFRAAAGVVVERFQNLRENLSSGVRDVEEIWAKGGDRVAAKADENGAKLAAPALAAKEKVVRATREIDRSLQDYLRVFNLQEAARQGAADDAAAIERTKLAQAEFAEQVRRTLDPTIALRAEIEKIQQAWKDGFFGTDNETPQNRIEQIERQIVAVNTYVGKAAQETTNWGREIGLTFTSAFEAAVAGGEKFSDVLKALGQDLAKLITRKTITEPMGKAFEESLKGFSFGKLFGGDTTETRAGGGTVGAGSSYLVGEHGPELFTPGADGMITPNDAMGGGPVFNVDMRGASVDAVARLEKLVRSINGSIESRALGVVRQARMRGA